MGCIFNTTGRYQFKKVSSSGSCGIKYKVVFTAFVAGDNDTNSIKLDTDAIKASADAAKTAAEQAKTSADTAKTAAYAAKAAAQAATPVLKVIKGTAFTRAMYGEFSGGDTSYPGLNASTSVGTGYTLITGTNSTFTSAGIKPAKIGAGQRLVLFDVIEPPTTAYTATVTFGN